VSNTVFNLDLADLRARRSMKWATFGPDVLPVWVAEMDCLPAPEVAEVVDHALRIGDTGYPTGSMYQEALAAYAGRHWDWQFDPAQDAIIVPDVMQGIIAVLDLLGTRGAPVVINPPVYPQFFKYLHWGARPIIEVPLTEAGRLDMDAMAAAFAGESGAKPEAYLLCNPHNPTATAHTRAELTRIVQLANKHGVRIISDEIHAPLVSGPEKFVPILTIDNVRDAVSIISASKAWNLAGLKAGLAIGSPDVADRLIKMPDEVTHSASYLGIVSHVAALEHGQPWLDRAMAEIEANRRLVASLLAEQLPHVRYHPGPATYLAWLDCRELGLPDPYKAFLTAGVAFNNGLSFGAPGAGHVRMNLATSPEIITEAVRRMALAVA
jgi:cystathionine beta-lyase